MRVFLLFAICLFSALHAGAQVCDCDDTGVCPQTFGPNYTGQICYDISDAFNDDLASPSQGVCGVSIVFTHQHIWDLELSLVSPAGQVVPLVGMNTNFFGTTNNVLWNILFIPCANIPAPDTINNTPFQPVWNNNQNWPFAATFSGSYHPVVGNCLESFNSGPVNGTWCLQIDNQPSPYSGQILNFEVILCDNSGLLCCDADAGNINVQDFAICEGDSSLLVQWMPGYGPIFPSPAEYGYAFVVSDADGVILLIESAPDLRNFAAGTYTVCGLSYLLADTANIPAPDGTLTLEDLRNNLEGPSPWFCGDLQEDCVEVQIVVPPAPVSLTETICHDEVFMVGDSAVGLSGQYNFTLQTVFNCDSILFLELTVLPADSIFLDVSVCFGENYAVGDSLYNQSGSYLTVLGNAQGCDSLVFLDLTALPPNETFLTDTICAGETFAVGDSLFSESGSYSVLLGSFQGCDSMVYLDLLLLTPFSGIALPDTITCAVAEVILDGSASSAGPQIAYQWTALTGVLALPLDEAQATALAPGQYELIVTEFSCQARDTVEVAADTLAPLAEVLSPDLLTCAVDSVLLDGTGSDSGPGIVYQWLGPQGGDTSFVWASTPGDYALVVFNSNNGCADTAFVSVLGDFLAPFVEAGPSSTLNCLDTTATLDGSQTWQDGNFDFVWQDAMGVPLAWTDSLRAAVQTPGMYFLTATNLDNGCAAIDSVEILLDTIAPMVDAGQNDSLTCVLPTLSLNGGGSSQSGQLTFFWESSDGHPISDPFAPDPEVGVPGVYLLTATDPVNFCTAIDSVEIFLNAEIPLADAGPSVTLNCNLNSWTVGNPDQTSLGPEFSYLWIGPGGDTISTELSTLINQGGMYLMFVFNASNGCVGTDSVFIEQEEDFPIAVVGPGGVLTCADPLILLDGSASTAGPFIAYAWIDPSGNVVGTNNQLSVGNAGQYCLILTNELNFCVDTACAEVLQGSGFPLVDAGPNEWLDCISGQAFLQGTVDPVLPDYEISWSTNGGNIITNPAQIAIIVDAPGWYVLTMNDTVNDCIVQDSALVLIDTAACMPLVNGGADGMINCYNAPFDTLDASQGTSAGLNITYQWTALSGTVFFGENTLFPIVTEGVFVLTVTNTSLDLTATDTVVVGEDLIFPTASAGPDQTIDCATINNDFFLDGTGSSQGPQYSYLWSTATGGFIISGAEGLTPLIGTQGLYDLEVTNTLNGCASVDAVLITLDGDPPTPCIATEVQIPCGFFSLWVGDTCALGAPYAYEWFITGGNILSDPAGAMVEVEWIDSVATLSGLITDTTNFCPVLVTVQLFAPLVCFPDCEIATPDTLTCDVTQITLDGTGSSVGVEFAYQWTAISGNLCGGETTLFPCVDAAGVYRLTVTDMTTQFVCSQDVWVLEDVSPPVMDAGPDRFLTCDEGEVALQGNAPPGLTYQWTGPAGCILSGAQTLAPLVACTGVYYLEVSGAANGCIGIDSVAVAFDTLSPLAALQINGILTCADTTTLITSQGSALGPNITYQWSLNGNILATGLGSWTATEAGVYCLRVTNDLNGCFSEACDTLILDAAPPPADAGSDSTLTCGVTSILLEGNPVPGGNFSVIWTGPSGCVQGDPASGQITADCPGVYIFQVTDMGNGCAAYDTLLVESQTVPPVALISLPDTITCLQPQVSLDGTSSLPQGGVAFLWSTGDGILAGAVDGPLAVAEAGGTYQLVVQDLFNQCLDTAQVVVVEDVAFPDADAGPDGVLTCLVTQLTLGGAGSSQGDEFVYSWISPPGVSLPGVLFPEINQAGQYILTVLDTSNACLAMDTVIIASDTASPLADIEVNGAPVITCLQSQVSLSGALSQPAGGLVFSWHSAAGQIQGDPAGVGVIALSAGLYSLVVQDLQNGCRDTAFVEVNEDLQPPEILILPPDTLTCARTSVVLDASGSFASGPMEIVWTGPGAIGDSLTLTPIVYQAGVYFLEITNQDNGCAAMELVVVVQDTIAPLATASTPGVLDCETTQLTLSGAGSSTGLLFQYEWTGPPGAPVGNSGSLSPVVSQPGVYVLTVSNLQNGCESEAAVEVFSEGAPILGLSLDLILPTCFDDRDGGINVTSVLGGTAPFLFSFADIGFYPHTQFNYLVAGNYELIVEDDNGCRFDTLVFLPNPNELTLDLGPDQYIKLGESAVVEGIANVPEASLSSVEWQPYSDPLCPECLVFEVSPSHTTTFVAVIRDENGCIASDQTTIFVEKEEVLYMPNAFSPNGDGENDAFFPQAGSGVALIELLQIFDRWGNLLFEGRNFPPNDPTFGWDGNFKGRPMNSHVYVWQCRVLLEDGTENWYKGDVALIR